MKNLSSLNVPYLAVLCFILLLSGIAEYLHLAPSGTFYTFLLLVIGLVAPSPLVHSPVVGPNQNVQVESNAPTPLGAGQNKAQVDERYK